MSVFDSGTPLKTKNKKIEILAPCGSMDSVYAAVRSGADAIYLGAKDFSARASAENFDYPQLKEAVDYCHINRVKVYLTLNTVVFDEELNQVAETIKSAAKVGVDALIVQNIGVATLAKQLVPDLPLHGSTQMSVHSLGGAKLLWEMGFKRVVLAREMSLEEIREIAENCPIELEVFVHGALCMSVSGQCYFSAMLGGRSGNRGRCAQPCRLPFKIGKSEYSLSLKDNSVISFLPELEKLGISSAKIEGRMKRPEYVSCAVSACAEMRDKGSVSEKTAENLASVFSRTGFTEGYITGERKDMFGYRKKDDVISATSKLLSDIRATYKDEKKKVSLRGTVTCRINEVPTLFLTDGENSVTVFGENICEKALKKALDPERAVAQLSKTGGTPYFIEKIDTDFDNDVIIPMSALNELRRKALEKINENVINSKKYQINDIIIPDFEPYFSKEKKKIYVRVPHTDLGKGFLKADLCFVPLFSNEKEIRRLLNEGFKIAVEIPRGMFGREKKIYEKLKTLMSLGIKDVLCNNLGAVYVAKKLGAVIHGGFGLNFVNTLDLLWAENYGFEDTELSFELTFKQIENLGAKLKRGIVSYGYLPLMLVRNCPNKSDKISCKDCKKKGKMTDRLNKSFIFYCDGCCTEILNIACTDVREYTEKLSTIDFEVFRISVENSVEKVENISDFLSETLNFAQITHGLYLRGII